MEFSGQKEIPDFVRSRKEIWDHSVNVVEKSRGYLEEMQGKSSKLAVR